MPEVQKPKLESFEIKDHKHDSKIDALNVFATIKIKDYLDIARSIKNNNTFQRRRVSKPSTIYALLNNQEINEAEREMENLNYSQFKEKVIRDLNTELALIQIKYKEYRAKIEVLLKSKLASLRWVANRKMDIIYRQLKLL